jgi:hypothetical protein
MRGGRPRAGADRLCNLSLVALVRATFLPWRRFFLPCRSNINRQARAARGPQTPRPRSSSETDPNLTRPRPLQPHSPDLENTRPAGGRRQGPLPGHPAQLQRPHGQAPQPAAAGGDGPGRVGAVQARLWHGRLPARHVQARLARRVPRAAAASHHRQQAHHGAEVLPGRAAPLRAGGRRGRARACGGARAGWVGLCVGQCHRLSTAQ